MTYIHQVKKFLSEVHSELTRVEWPKTPEFIGVTIVTLFIVLVFALYLGGLDRIIAALIHRVFALGA